MQSAGYLQNCEKRMTSDKKKKNLFLAQLNAIKKKREKKRKNGKSEKLVESRKEMTLDLKSII